MDDDEFPMSDLEDLFGPEIKVESIPSSPRSRAIVDRRPLSSISSPNTAPHQTPSTPDGTRSPFVRPPFPLPVLPFPRVTGLSATTVLRTCFRIGEAINAASVALRESADALFELYCRVKHSDREPNGYQQLFEFVDLYNPDSSPIIEGVCTIWKGVDLWDFDLSAFLGEKGRGKMARVMGRMKRKEGGRGWEMTVLNIWEAKWEDIEVVKDIVCSSDTKNES